MEPKQRIVGRMMPIYQADIDTDQIMPKQFLKRVERHGFGEFIFHDWRQRVDFILNDERYRGASILVTGPNFGAGSSREHAPWGLQDYGFEALIAPSFADIFAKNCAQIGLLTIELEENRCRQLIDGSLNDPSTQIEIDIPEQTIDTGGDVWPFALDALTKRRVLEGLDAVGYTLSHEASISRYEADRPAWRPVTTSEWGEGVAAPKA